MGSEEKCVVMRRRERVREACSVSVTPTFVGVAGGGNALWCGGVGGGRGGGVGGVWGGGWGGGGVGRGGGWGGGGEGVLEQLLFSSG